MLNMRGFFELVAVSILTLGLVLALDWVTLRQNKSENNLFRALSVVMVCLTLFMLLSAWQRMSLYETEFGFTHLRIYTRVFMVWLAALFGFFLLALFNVRENIFALGVLFVSIGFLGSLNLLNVDRYIAERNIDRYYAGEVLDVRFLGLLSADAVPAIIEFYYAVRSDPNTNPQLIADLEQILALQLYQLDVLRERGGGSTLMSGNMARDSAWQMLDSLRGGLPQYEAYADLWRNSSRNYSAP
jgi:hypothetical protein